jgi:hypothetical protein
LFDLSIPKADPFKSSVPDGGALLQLDVAILPEEAEEELDDESSS